MEKLNYQTRRLPPPMPLPSGDPYRRMRDETHRADAWVSGVAAAVALAVGVLIVARLASGNDPSDDRAGGEITDIGYLRMTLDALLLLGGLVCAGVFAGLVARQRERARPDWDGWLLPIGLNFIAAALALLLALVNLFIRFG